MKNFTAQKNDNKVTLYRFNEPESVSFRCYVQISTSKQQQKCRHLLLLRPLAQTIFYSSLPKSWCFWEKKMKCEEKKMTQFHHRMFVHAKCYFYKVEKRHIIMRYSTWLFFPACVIFNTFTFRCCLMDYIRQQVVFAWNVIINFWW